MRLRRSEFPRDDGRERLAGKERLQEVRYGATVLRRANFQQRSAKEGWKEGRKGFKKEYLELEHLLEIPRTQRHPHASAFEVGDQLVEARLGLLIPHGGGFDGADGGLGLLLGGLGERVDVVEDVG